MAVQEDLLEKGFQLAYFIFPSRSTAVLILSSALNKLHAQRGREARRSYWRDKHLKRGITRITREEGDALQWLIFYESDKYEKQQESDDDPSLRDMVVRYIKNLVRMTTAMSSFYVNIGLHRLLHNYTTAETQRIYEAITDRYLGSDEYRRAKGLLMGKLEKRFGRLLRTLRAQHGELRFEVMQDQAPWAALVDTCLKAFTPWSTATNCPVPRDFDATQGKLPPHLSGVGTDKLDPNEIEINRCHAFIDPVCYGRLAEALTFEAPSRKLAVPRFYMDNARNDGPSTQPPQQGGLTAEERKTILDEISNQDSRRQKINPQFISLVVDGVEKARLNLDSQRSYGFEIEEGAELLEVIADDAGKELVLAAEPIQYTESKGIAASETSLFTFRRGELALSISPFPQPAGGPRFAMASVSYTPRGWALRKVTAASGWRLFPRLAIPGLALLLLGWFVGRITITRTPAPRPIAAPQPAPVPTPIQQSAASARAGLEKPLVFNLISDDLVTRGAGGSDVVVAVPSQPAVITLNLPINPESRHRSFRAALSEFPRERELLRENGLRAKSSPAGNVLTFLVPSQFLKTNQNYTVKVTVPTSGGSQELNSYSFRTIKKLE